MTPPAASLAEAAEARPLRYSLAGTLTLAWPEVLDVARTAGPWHPARLEALATDLEL